MDMPTTEAAFEPADMAQWTAMVARVLKGAGPESLDRTDEDGLVTRALYPVDKDAPPPSWHLPAASHARLAEGWQVVQIVPPASGNSEVLDSLASGATALSLLTGDIDTMESQLAGVVLSAVAVTLDDAAATPAHYHRLLTMAGPDAAVTTLDLGLDPIDGFAAGMTIHATAPSRHRLFRSDGWHWHNRGLTAAQELGVVTAGCAALLRAAEAADHDMADMVGRISARLALPADMFAGIVTCRAMRRLWDGLLAGCGLDPTPLPISAQASLRMMSVLDPDVNMLRMTTALLGGAIGGADAMAGFGHDILTGETEDARRIARLAQVMMMAESNLHASLDPSAGSPFIESRTDALAQAGWHHFQHIEQAGGLAEARRSGMISDWADDAAAAREARLRAGDSDLLGVTLQPRAESVPDIMPAFGDVRRPAALIEDLRRTAATTVPRLLILRGDGDTSEGAVRARLAIAGLDAVTLPAESATIGTARPDWVIGCGVDIAPDGVPGDRFLCAADILNADDRLAVLARLAGRPGTTE